MANPHVCHLESDFTPRRESPHESEITELGIRACLRSSRPLYDAPEHVCGSGDEDEGFRDIGSLLEIADETAVLDQPREGPLDDPAAWQRLEARQGAWAFDDGQCEIGLPLRPIDEFSGVATIGEHGLDEAPQGTRGAQQWLGTIAVLYRGGLHLDSEQTTVGIGQDVALAARDLLARVVAARAPF